MVLAVLMTCHNRKSATLACLQRLYAQSLPQDLSFSVFLVDDGSSDGTSQAVQQQYPAVHLIRGNGNLFWAKGMRLAWEHAAGSNPDFYLWLNDDTHLLPEALPTLLKTWQDLANRGQGNTIIVGSCCNSETAEHTYGGQRRIGLHPLRMRPVTPEANPVPCDTFNGNLVLIPREVSQVVGLMGRFQHALGDIDYGFRALRHGCRVVLAPGYLAHCSRNRVKTHQDRSLGIRTRWRLLNARKGLPPGDWLRFAASHGGWTWPIWWVSPYAGVLLRV